MFSSSVEDALKKAGWTPERQIEVEWYTSPLLGYGYEVFPKVREFLTQFGGLTIYLKYKEGKVVFDISFHFNTGYAASDYGDMGFKYAKILGKPLCLIGDYMRYGPLLMDEEGKVYFGYEDVVSKFGDSAEEAIENKLTPMNTHKRPK